MFDKYKYLPKLALSPAEMGAYDELPDMDKDGIIPFIPLRGWVASKFLENSLNKIQEVIDGRFVVLDIDQDYIYDNKDYLITGEFPREVFYQLRDLLDSNNGYENWCNLVRENEWIIPVLQTKDISSVAIQYQSLCSLNRGVVIRFSLQDLESGKYEDVLSELPHNNDGDILVVVDLGRIGARVVEYSNVVVRYIRSILRTLPGCNVSITGSSFPDSFGERESGSSTIYERMLYTKVSQQLDCPLIYSDYGSARYKEYGGGGGIPVPRIDYPIKNEWFFNRQKFDSDESVNKESRKQKYINAAQEIIGEEFWVDGLNIWGERMILMTSEGDEGGIYSPTKATSVRINIHLYNQSNFELDLKGRDTDEDWED